MSLATGESGSSVAPAAHRVDSGGLGTRTRRACVHKSHRRNGHRYKEQIESDIRAKTKHYDDEMKRLAAEADPPQRPAPHAVPCPPGATVRAHPHEESILPAQRILLHARTQPTRGGRAQHCAQPTAHRTDCTQRQTQ